MTEIERLWNEHMTAAFPQGVAGEEVDGVDLGEIDTFAAGCISAFLGNKGTLDADRVKILKKCVFELESILSKLSGEVSSYFDRLHRIGCLVLNDAHIR